MTDPTPPPDSAGQLPKARIRRRRWTLPIVWVVPLAAAVVAGYLVYGRLEESGPTITINFKDGSGVKPAQTEIRYRGVPIGQVQAIDLSTDGEAVVVTARLRRSAAMIAREGSAFWIVRPEVGPGTITGLSTVLTGPYIQVLPGPGKPASQFTGLENPPAALERQGLKVVLAASHIESVRTGSPVYYRGIDVGSVTGIELSSDTTAAHVHLFISQRYARLVRVGSRFWTVSGLDVNVSLLKGVEISVESLRSLLAGGIAFATPDDPVGRPARDGTVFVLHDKPEKEWLTWAPKIPLPPSN